MTMGLGSINADSYQVDGVEALYNEAGGVRLGFGPASSANLSSGGLLTLESSNMVVSPHASGTSALASIDGGGGRRGGDAARRSRGFEPHSGHRG